MNACKAHPGGAVTGRARITRIDDPLRRTDTNERTALTRITGTHPCYAPDLHAYHGRDMTGALLQINHPGHHVGVALCVERMNNCLQVMASRRALAVEHGDRKLDELCGKEHKRLAHELQLAERLMADVSNIQNSRPRYRWSEFGFGHDSLAPVWVFDALKNREFATSADAVSAARELGISVSCD